MPIKSDKQFNHSENMARRSMSKNNVMASSIEFRVREPTDREQSQMNSCGDWTPDDHATYLRLKQRCKNNSQTLIKTIQRVLPGKTDDEIVEHDDWYRRYQLLRTEQRANQRRARSVQVEMHSQDSARLSTKAMQIRDRKERAETKRRIEQWKQRKIDQKRVEEEQRDKLLREMRHEKEGYKVLNELATREGMAAEMRDVKPRRKVDIQHAMLQKEREHINNFHRSMEANRNLFDISTQGERCAQKCQEPTIGVSRASRSRLPRHYAASQQKETQQKPLRKSAVELTRDTQRQSRPNEQVSRRRPHPNQTEDQLDTTNNQVRQYPRSLSVKTMGKSTNSSFN